MLREEVILIWPELGWIEDADLKEKVLQTWTTAFERSPLEPKDPEEIPFTLLIPDCPSTFMEHARCVVHIAKQGAIAMGEFLGKALLIDMDTVTELLELCRQGR